MAALLAEGNDADLLKIIADERERHRDWADGALMELYRRHLNVAYAVCRRICTTYLGNENQTEDLLMKTFDCVFKAAEKFDLARANCGDDAESISRAVRCWIVRRARWLAKDVINSAAMCGGLVHPDSESLNRIGIEDEVLPECSPKVLEAIDRLPLRDRHIVLAFYFMTDGDTGKPVPPDVTSIDIYCARRWGTTPSNVRQIRSRALETLREWLAPVNSPVASAR